MATKKAAQRAQISYAFTADAEENAQTIEAMVSAIGDDWPAYLHIHNRMPMPLVLPGCVRGMYLQHTAAPNEISAGMYLVSNVEKLHKLALEVQALAKMNRFSGGITMLIGDVENPETPIDPNAPPIVVLFTSHPESEYEIERGAKVVLQSSVTGGTPPYTYTWRKGTVVLTGQSAATFTIDEFQADDAGDYSLTASDNKGGKGTQSVTFAMQATEPLTASFAAHETEIAYNTKASLVAQASGGKPPYSYVWKLNGTAIAGQSGATLTTDAFKPVNVGAYEVVVSDYFGDTASAQTTLKAQALDAIEVQLDSSAAGDVDYGASVTLEATATGGLAPYSYAWAKDGAAIAGSGASLTISDFDADKAGTYTVTVTDKLGNTATGEVELEIEQLAVLEVTTENEGETIDVSLNNSVSIIATATGGLEPYSYEWLKDGQVLQGASGRSFSIGEFTQENEGTYAVKVTDKLGNEATSQGETYQLEAIEAVQVTLEAPSEPMPLGEMVRIVAKPTGGVPPYSYVWQHNGIPNPDYRDDNVTIFSLQENQQGTYTVNVTDSMSQTANASTVLEAIIPPLVAQISGGRSPIPEGEEIALMANFEGGVAPYDYVWDKDGVPRTLGESVLMSVPNCKPSDSGVYTVTISDGAGNTSKDSFEVIVEAKAPLEVEFEAPFNAPEVELDAGDDAEIKAIVTGGAEPYEYLWTFNGVALRDGEPGGASLHLSIDDFDHSKRGLYACEVTDAKGDKATTEVNVLLVGLEPIAVDFDGYTSGDTQTLEYGANVTLKGTASGGKAPYTYAWRYHGEPIEGATTDTIEITNFDDSKKGIYLCLATDAYGDTGGGAIEFVPEVLAPIVVTSPDLNSHTHEITEGDSFTIHAHVEGGKPPYSYEWSLNAQVLDNTSDVLELTDFDASKAGVYVCKVTDPWGGSGSNDVTVNLVAKEPEIEPLRVTFGNGYGVPEPIQLAEGETLVITSEVTGGVPPYSYQWDFGGKNGTQQLPEASGTLTVENMDADKAGLYVLTVRDAGTSVAAESQEFALIEPDPIPPLDSVLEGVNRPTHTISVGTPVEAKLVVTGGVPPYTYEWSKDGNTVTDQTGDTFRIDHPYTTDSGVYAGVATDQMGTRTAKSWFMEVEGLIPGGMSSTTTAKAAKTTTTKATAAKTAAKKGAETSPKTTTKRTTK